MIAGHLNKWYGERGGEDSFLRMIPHSVITPCIFFVNLQLIIRYRAHLANHVRDCNVASSDIL